MNYSEINILLFDSLLDNNLNELKKKKRERGQYQYNIAAEFQGTIIIN